MLGLTVSRFHSFWPEHRDTGTPVSQPTKILNLLRTFFITQLNTPLQVPTPISTIISQNIGNSTIEVSFFKIIIENNGIIVVFDGPLKIIEKYQLTETDMTSSSIWPGKTVHLSKRLKHNLA